MLPSSHDPADSPEDPSVPCTGGAAPAAEAAPPSAGSPRLTRRKRISIELALVMLVVWTPLFVDGLRERSEVAAPEGWALPIGGLLYGAGLFALLAYFAWLDGDPRTFLGLRRPRLADLGWSVVALIATAVVSRIAVFLFLALFSPDGASASPEADRTDVAAWAWLLPYHWFVWAWLEEALYRAYLWNRLTELSRRPVLSIFVTSALFAVAHGYPLAATLSVFFAGLVLGWMFSARRSLWPLVLAHWTYNLWIT